jgi:hypothetical protein
MECKCGSKNLFVYWGNGDYLSVNITDGVAYFRDPSEKEMYFNTRYPCSFFCRDCNEFSNTEEILEEIISRKIDHKEITLDLDHTLICTGMDIEDQDFDITYKGNKFSGKKRPYLNKFLEYCEERFDKINIFTASMPEYAHEVIKNLGISKGKLGFVKTVKDTFLARTIKFDREYIKKMNDSLIVEDKPHVVEGYNNSIIKIKPYYGCDNDEELLRVIEVLNQEETIVKLPKLFSGKLEFFLRGLSIEINDLTMDNIKEVLSIEPSTQEELRELPHTTTYSKPIMTFSNNEIKIVFNDVNSYEKYLELTRILKTKGRIVSKHRWDKSFIIKDRKTKSMIGDF